LSKNIESISEFLIHAGTQYLLFDMGRCIRSIDTQAFLSIENGQIQAPYPRQQHFWCGVVYWNKNLSAQRYIWFIKLPVDEHGCVVDAARQHFLEKILTALTRSQSENTIDLAQTEQNSSNPYIYQPNQQQLADFNAQTRKRIGLSPCDDYQLALNYLKAPYIQDWRDISLQGLADVVAFVPEDQLTAILASLKSLPATVRQHLLSSLENVALSQQQVNSIVNDIEWQSDRSDNSLTYQLRALSQMPSESQRQQLISKILNHTNALTRDMLVVIAGRHWLGLHGENMMHFLEIAAELDTDLHSYSFFCSLFADIAQLPQIRNEALKALREPDRSSRLSDAIGALFKRKPS
jgi:hypothetical protein